MDLCWMCAGVDSESCEVCGGAGSGSAANARSVAYEPRPALPKQPAQAHPQKREARELVQKSNGLERRLQEDSSATAGRRQAGHFSKLAGYPTTSAMPRRPPDTSEVPAAAAEPANTEQSVGKSKRGNRKADRLDAHLAALEQLMEAPNGTTESRAELEARQRQAELAASFARATQDSAKKQNSQTLHQQSNFGAQHTQQTYCPPASTSTEQSRPPPAAGTQPRAAASSSKNSNASAMEDARDSLRPATRLLSMCLQEHENGRAQGDLKKNVAPAARELLSEAKGSPEIGSFKSVLEGIDAESANKKTTPQTVQPSGSVSSDARPMKSSAEDDPLSKIIRTTTGIDPDVFRPQAASSSEVGPKVYSRPGKWRTPQTNTMAGNMHKFGSGGL
eukprot:TRINITY_DN13367_c0_g1_i1.p1 TRINITY_DN13367_c0_g1~~TRINITY_DN13367_c0_g1_i1.p1  ORF type:complete len:391 (-),score=78.62 TRINITY_DN13367_c0_g1_i1:276-1448(-)